MGSHTPEMPEESIKIIELPQNIISNLRIPGVEDAEKQEALNNFITPIEYNLKILYNLRNTLNPEDTIALDGFLEWIQNDLNSGDNLDLQEYARRLQNLGKNINALENKVRESIFGDINKIDLGTINTASLIVDNSSTPPPTIGVSIGVDESGRSDGQYTRDANGNIIPLIPNEETADLQSSEIALPEETRNTLSENEKGNIIIELDHLEIYLNIISESHEQENEITSMINFIHGTSGMLEGIDSRLLYIKNSDGEQYIFNFIQDSINKIQIFTNALENNQDLNIDISSFEGRRQDIIRTARSNLEELNIQMSLWQELDQVLSEDYFNILGTSFIPSLLFSNDPEIIRSRHQIYTIPELNNIELDVLYNERLNSLEKNINGFSSSFTNKTVDEIINNLEGGDNNLKYALGEILQDPTFIERLRQIYTDPGLTNNQVKELFLNGLLLSASRDIEALVIDLKGQYDNGSNILFLSENRIEFNSEREKKEAITAYITFIDGLMKDPYTSGQAAMSIIITIVSGGLDLKTGLISLVSGIDNFLPLWGQFFISVAGVLSLSSIPLRYGIRRQEGSWRHERVKEKFINQDARGEFNRGLERYIIDSEGSVDALWNLIKKDNEGNALRGLSKEQFVERIDIIRFITRNNELTPRIYQEMGINTNINSRFVSNLRSDILLKENGHFYTRLDWLVRKTTIEQNIIRVLRFTSVDFTGVTHNYGGDTRILPGRRLIGLIPWSEKFVAPAVDNFREYWINRMTNYSIDPENIRSRFGFIARENMDFLLDSLNSTSGKGEIRRAMGEIVKNLNDLVFNVGSRGSQLSIFSDATYAHINNILQDFREGGIELRGSTGINSVESLSKELIDELDMIRTIYPNSGTVSDYLGNILDNNEIHQLHNAIIAGLQDTNDQGRIIRNIRDLYTELINQDRALRSVSAVGIEGKSGYISIEENRKSLQSALSEKITALKEIIGAYPSDSPEIATRLYPDSGKRGGETPIEERITIFQRAKEKTLIFLEGIGNIFRGRATGERLLNGNSELRNTFEQVKEILINNYNMENIDSYFQNILNERYLDTGSFQKSINNLLLNDGYLTEIDGDIDWAAPTPEKNPGESTDVSPLSDAERHNLQSEFQDIRDALREELLLDAQIKGNSTDDVVTLMNDLSSMFNARIQNGDIRTPEGISRILSDDDIINRIDWDVITKMNIFDDLDNIDSIRRYRTWNPERISHIFDHLHLKFKI